MKDRNRMRVKRKVPQRKPITKKWTSEELKALNEVAHRQGTLANPKSPFKTLEQLEQKFRKQGKPKRPLQYEF